MHDKENQTLEIYWSRSEYYQKKAKATPNESVLQAAP
jgi:hypothetical protein